MNVNGVKIGMGLAIVFALVIAELQLYKTKDELRDVHVLADDKLRERDRAWELYQQDEVKLKNFQDECSGINCKDMFNSEAAGVVATTYWPMKMDVRTIIQFCHHSNLVNLGQNFPGARLSSFGQVEENRGVGPEFLITCAWIVPSKLWCQKDALNP